MKQILNIFRTDTRHFWPEILLSVVVTIAFAVAAPNEWRVFHDSNDRQRMVIFTACLGFLMVISWWLLVARAVHAETLVGDRQFWLTRPYVWNKLLGAKVLFGVVWIGVPYLLVQILVLGEAGYSPLGYAPGLLMQLLMMSCVLLLPLFSLTAVTANFARLTLTLLACLVLFVGFLFLINGHPSAYTPANPYSNRVLHPLLFCGCAGIIALQYATRRVWVSRALLVALAILLAVSAAAYDRQSLVDRAYPRPGAGPAAPVSIAAVPTEAHPIEARSYEGQDFVDFPIRYSGVAEGYTVATADFRFTLTAADGSQWTSPWQQKLDRIQPGDHTAFLSLPIRPAVYDRFKSGPVTLQVTFAVSRYQADSVATTTFPGHDQGVPGIGFCSDDRGFGEDTLVCTTAMRQPRLTYFTTPVTNTPCSVASGPTQLAHAWLEPGNPDFGLAPVWISRLLFFYDARDPERWHVCAGRPLTVTQYHLVDRTRASFTLTDFVLPANVQPT